MSSEESPGSKSTQVAPLLSALRDLSAWLLATEVRGAVIGGVAASFLGRPRFTRDVDVMVLLDEERWADFLTAGEPFGFEPRLTDALAFARSARVLLMRHESSGIDIDVAFGILPFEEEAIGNVTWVKIGDVRIPLPRPEDLIIMKAVAHRTRDLTDIEAILDVHPKLDTKRILQWAREFSRALEMPEIMSDIEALLSKYRERK
jgi:hypothetical protein